MTTSRAIRRILCRVAIAAIVVGVVGTAQPAAAGCTLTATYSSSSRWLSVDYYPVETCGGEDGCKIDRYDQRPQDFTTVNALDNRFLLLNDGYHEDACESMWCPSGNFCTCTFSPADLTVAFPKAPAAGSLVFVVTPPTLGDDRIWPRGSEGSNVISADLARGPRGVYMNVYALPSSGGAEIKIGTILAPAVGPPTTERLAVPAGLHFTRLRLQTDNVTPYVTNGILIDVVQFEASTAQCSLDDAAPTPPAPTLMPLCTTVTCDTALYNQVGDYATKRCASTTCQASECCTRRCPAGQYKVGGGDTCAPCRVCDVNLGQVAGGVACSGTGSSDTVVCSCVQPSSRVCPNGQTSQRRLTPATGADTPYPNHQCSFEPCDNPTCATGNNGAPHVCPGPDLVAKPSLSSIVCTVTCNNDRCCDPKPGDVTCANANAGFPFRCANGTYLKLNAASLLCGVGTATCQASFCCLPPGTCTGTVCQKATEDLVAVASTSVTPFQLRSFAQPDDGLCRGQTCDPTQCCYQPSNCGMYECPVTTMAKVFANAFEVVCAGEICTMAECCDPVLICINADCPSHMEHTPLASETMLSAACASTRECVVPLCCADNPTCGAFLAAKSCKARGYEPSPTNGADHRCTRPFEGAPCSAEECCNIKAAASSGSLGASVARASLIIVVVAALVASLAVLVVKGQRYVKIRQLRQSVNATHLDPIRI